MPPPRAAYDSLVREGPWPLACRKRLIGRQALEELRMVVQIIEYTKGISNTQLRQELAK